MKPFSASYSRVAFFVLAVVLIVLAVLITVPFIPAILWATVLSVLLWPVYGQWRRYLSKKPIFANGRADTVAALFTTLAALIIIVIPFLLIGGGIYQQAQSIIEDIASSNPEAKHPLSVNGILNYIDTVVQPVAARLGQPAFSVSEYFQTNRRDIVQSIRQPVTKAASQVLFTGLTLVIALLTMFFTLRDSERLKQPVIDLIPLPAEKTEALLKRLSDTIWAVFVGTVLVAIIQGSVLGVTFFFLGVPNSLLLGVFAVILCIIPLLGSPFLYIPVGLLFLSKGEVGAALWTFGVGFGIVSNIDNALKPFLIGGRANLHPMPVFFAILGGVLLIGPIGVMAGPMVLTSVLFIFDVLREQAKELPEGIETESVAPTAA